VTERPGLIRSRYFAERPDLVLGADEIVLISGMRNELLRLPYFLEYHRALGVDRFLLVDNDSDGGTREYLAGQPDVEYFHTDTSYLGSYNGRGWVQELAETYAEGHWILFADIDELLVYPGVELFGLRDFCRYLDGAGYEGLFAVLLDMYSDVPLHQTVYESGTDFLRTCRYFDVDSYRLRPGENPPFLSVFGGPRRRLTERTEGPRAAFQQRKIPLVKWRHGFSFQIYAHDARYLRLADVTGALLHFKYFATWADRVVQDAARGDRNPRSYAFYKERVDRDLCFHDATSQRYDASSDLVGLGVMTSTPALRQFYESEATARDGDAAAVPALLPEPEPATDNTTLRSIATLWPFVNNPSVARYFGQLELAPKERRRLVRDLSGYVHVVDVWPDRVLLALGQRVLHDDRSRGLALAAYLDGRLLDQVMLDDTAATLEADVDALIWNVFRWHVDVRAAAADADRTTIEVYLVDTTLPVPGAADAARAAGIRIFARPWFRDATGVRGADDYRGVVESYADGTLRGWSFDVGARSFDLPVAVYVENRLVAFAEATAPRPGLAVKQELPRSVGRGFQATVPLGYFRDRGLATARVDVRIAGTNVSLAHAPFELPTGAAALRWDKRRGWVVPRPDGR
jgi:hypothetical protein